MFNSCGGFGNNGCIWIILILLILCCCGSGATPANNGFANGPYNGYRGCGEFR